MVDPARTPLGRMIVEEISPVVMVLTTPSVEDACRKNGLSLVQMLSPFSSFSNIDVPVRTASDQPYRLHKFRLRLFYGADIRQPDFQSAKERLKNIVSQAVDEDNFQLHLEAPQIETLLNRSENEIVPTWFESFNKELIQTLSFSDHEAFDHPVACLLAVSSREDHTISRLIDLFNSNPLPSFNNGTMDPKILKRYMLVHDNHDGTHEKASRILAEMKSKLGPNDCLLLCINSAQDESVKPPEGPWSANHSVAPNESHLGRFLDADDLNEIKILMQDLTSKHIIPHMEQKIRVLNQQVAATRKGFRNQIKNLWWRKGKDDVIDTSDGPTYTFNSIESQIRVLGDYAFMLRDYELALSNYRLISTDYKLDKAWKRYAGVQEIMGLTYFMLDESKKDAENCMENAFTTYIKTGPSSQKNANRCGLWWVEMLKTRDQYREAANVYFRIPGEDPLHTAVMLEQASYCYLFSTPPMLRKYGFHIILSGDHYRKCDQIKHAIRAYRSAISVYQGTPWSHIHDHVQFHLGKWYAYLGISDVAVKHMMNILACRHQSKTTQETFMKDFLQIVQENGATFEVQCLQLPVINLPSLKVMFEDHRTYGMPTAASVKESLWRSLEEDMLPSTSTTKSNWLDIKLKLIKKYKDSNICVAGEAINVDVEFKNPLLVPINISGVSLICKLSVNDKDSDEVIQSHDDESSFKPTNSSDTGSGGSSFSLSEVDCSLTGGERIMVRLTVTPNVEGILKLVGLRWKLCGSVTGFCNFESSPETKKIHRGRRKPRGSPKDNLRFVVIKPLPRLEGFIYSIPERVYAGDVRQLTLEMKNQSEFAIKNVKMKISNPRFLNIGSHQSSNVVFPTCIEKESKREQMHSEADLTKVANAVFSFPEDTTIQGGKPFLWPIWLRAALPGSISLYIVIYYEMDGVPEVMTYRTLRMQYNVQVLPSMEVSYQISPCPLRLQEFLVRMDVLNRTISESFCVHQLSCVGNGWEVSLLHSDDAASLSEKLLGGQAMSCFFKLKNVRKSTSDDNKASSPTLTGSDLRLSSCNVNGALYDITCSPLADFHYSERLHQGLSLQGHPSTVDFILISQPGRGSNGTESSGIHHLYTHHSCHCSLANKSPISWLVDGPRTVWHNFSIPYTEIKLKMIIHNSSNDSASVQISTFDSVSDDIIPSSDTAPAQTGQVGWHDISLVNNITVTSDILKSPSSKCRALESVSPFIWSGTSSTKVILKPASTTEIPLQVCVFTPGTYDLSSYTLEWRLLPSHEHPQTKRASSGTCQGYPYHLTVLQSV
uniref:Trafficking protein particle complex subunit 8 n=1 Tax=Kalanchoe fedtschenkoi TaxID=63787 RepID=A0A7N0ULV5_KALFE